MPGLFVALAVFAAIAFAGTHAAAARQKMTLAAGKRWLVTAGFPGTPDQQTFEDTFRANAVGFVVEQIAWPTPNQALITVSASTPIPIDLGAPGPGDLFGILSATEAPAAPAVAGRALAERPGAWLLTLAVDGTVMDKRGFEESLRGRLRARILKLSWGDAHLIQAIVIAPASLSRFVGRRALVRNIPITILGATRLPT